MKKKGVVEIQFNWIFVLVVGAIILIFFFGFVQKQKGFAEEKNAVRIMTDLEAVAVGAQISKESVFPINIPRASISFSCDEDCLCTYEIAGVSKDYKDAIMYGPTPLEGSEIIFWNKAFTYPFRSTNVLYIGGQLVKYYIIYDPHDLRFSNQFKTILEKNIPDNFNVVFVNATSTDTILDANDPFTKIIVLGTNTIPITQINSFIDDINKRFEDQAINVVVIEDDKGLTFYEKRSVTQRLSRSSIRPRWTDEKSMYASLFTNNNQMYICNLKRILQRMQQITPILIKRIEYIEREASLRCSYSDALNYLNNMNESSNAILAADNFEYDNREWENLKDSQENLKRANQILLQQNCPQIY